MEKIVKRVRVRNKLGLHTRPATVIVQLLKDTKSQVMFTYKKETVNAKSILSILMLAVQKNATLTITITGDDASQTMGRLVQAFEGCFGEQDQGEQVTQ